VYLDFDDGFTSVSIYVKTHKTVYFKYLRFVVCQLCLNQVVQMKQRELHLYKKKKKRFEKCPRRKPREK
jgi:citrate lyase synthetase